jgi:hypothetical protein
MNGAWFFLYIYIIFSASELQKQVFLLSDLIGTVLSSWQRERQGPVTIITCTDPRQVRWFDDDDDDD